jgi:hypothetical protein
LQLNYLTYFQESRQFMKIFYLRDERKFPVACVASELLDGGKTVRFAVATHNPADRFDRVRAREVAAGRLHKSKNIAEIARPEVRIKAAVVTAIMMDESLSTRTRDAARLWLSQEAANAAQ